MHISRTIFYSGLGALLLSVLMSILYRSTQVFPNHFVENAFDKEYRFLKKGDILNKNLPFIKK